MVVPMDRLTIIVVMVCIMLVPVVTADTSAAVPNWPTIITSTAPYMVCRNMASSTGSANRISGPSTGPCVKSCMTFFMIHPLLSRSKKAPDRTRASQPAILSGASFPVNELPPMNSFILAAPRNGCQAGL